MLLRIYDNAFAIGHYSRIPSCYYIKGYREGFIGALTGKSVASEETRCISKGDPYCEFQIRLK